MLTVAECQSADGICDEKVQREFVSLLTSGQYVSLIQDTIFVADRARNLLWKDNIRLKGADSTHLTSALEMGCVEFLTTDENHFLNYKKKGFCEAWDKCNLPS
jgi:hypothetical protein